MGTEFRAASCIVLQVCRKVEVSLKEKLEWKQRTIVQRERSLGGRNSRIWHINSVGSDKNPTTMMFFFVELESRIGASSYKLLNSIRLRITQRAAWDCKTGRLVEYPNSSMSCVPISIHYFNVRYLWSPSSWGSRRQLDRQSVKHFFGGRLCGLSSGPSQNRGATQAQPQRPGLHWEKRLSTTLGEKEKPSDLQN